MIMTSAEEENIIKNRILLRELSIKKLTNKYIDFLMKFNELARNEMVPYIKEILNEIDMINISLLKAENHLKLKEIDKNYHSSIADSIDQRSQQCSGEIKEFSEKLKDAKKEKEYKILCEEISQIINKYNSKHNLQNSLNNLTEENLKVKNDYDKLFKKINKNSKKLSLLIKLIDDLNNNLDESSEG